MASFLLWLIGAISSLIGILYLNKTLYAVAGFFATRKYPRAKGMHRYAVLVAARNEELVIGNLIESIQNQDYPQELVDVFVVADNCTDATAKVAACAGAICYERRDPVNQTKGYALQFLVERIRRDYGIEAYEGYFIFDADNLLKNDYISRMNEAFDAGEKVVTSYRNIKNFDANWIAASYGIHWLRTIRMEHRARSLFRMATRVQGTGYLFSWELIKDGWNDTCLTEDRAFCAKAVAKGYRISYQDRAEFYDEQPEKLRIALRQRLRWAKGNLIVMGTTGWILLRHMLRPCPDSKPDPSLPWSKRFLKNMYLRLLSADMFTIVYPRSMMLLFRKFAEYLLRIWLICGGAYGFVSGKLLPSTVGRWTDRLGISWIPESTGQAIAILTLIGFLAAVSTYFERVLCAMYILFVERKHLVSVPRYRKLWYALTFPAFDTIGKLAFCIALFTKVEWKPIPHKVALRVEELTAKQGR